MSMMEKGDHSLASPAEGGSPRPSGSKWLWMIGATALLFLGILSAGGMATSTPRTRRRLESKDEMEVKEAEVNNYFHQSTSSSSDAAHDRLYKEISQKTNLTLPLQPPYRILEVGQKRTGSTFQFQLLDAIAQVKSKGKYEVEFLGYLKKFVKMSERVDTFPESFVGKSHALDDVGLAQAQKDGKLIVFTSGMLPGDDLYNVGLYNQQRINLERCSMCEIDKYQPIFGLTDEELALIKDYMSSYEKIRQCCGLQMSKAERARLNGCNMTLVQQWRGYPHCELVDKHAVELKLMEFDPIIKHRANSPRDNWSQVGDCAKFDEMMAQGHTRTGRKYSCPYP
jgi:hypothetical protein